MKNRNLSFPMLFVSILSLSLSPALLAQTATDAPAATNVVPAAPAPATAAPAATEPAPATTAPSVPTERPATYTIVSGDSLWTIAQKFDTSVKKLQKLNNLKPHALLHPGQVLKIPPAKPDATKTAQ